MKEEPARILSSPSSREAHGGTLEIRSRTRGPDHGTTVVLTLRAV